MAIDSNKGQEFLEIHNSVVSQMTKKSNQLKDLKQYEPIRESISALCKAAKKSAETQFFGSRVIGLATEDSKLDVYVCIEGKTYNMFVKSVDQHQELKSLSSTIHASCDWEKNSYVLCTPVPILSCTYLAMDLECVISIINGLSTQNSLLTAHMFEIQPEAVSLFHFVNVWFEMQGAEKLKAHTVMLLVQFFLMSCNLMPTAENVQRNVPKVIIDGWEVQFDSNRSLVDYEIRAMSSYKDHIKDFFRFYKDHDYSKVMSTFRGKSYFFWHYKRLYPKFLKNGILIAGPCNQGKNCGIMDGTAKSNFIELCKFSYEFLKEVEL